MINTRSNAFAAFAGKYPVAGCELAELQQKPCGIVDYESDESCQREIVKGLMVGLFDGYLMV